MIKGYLIITLLLITDFVLYLLKGISLSGQLSDKILFWVWLIMTIIVAIKYFKSSKWLKWYLGILGVAIILSIIPMGIPFFKLTEFATNIKFEKRVENYRLRYDEVGLIDHLPLIKVVRNLGAIEIEIDEMDFGSYSENYSLYDVDKIRLLREGNGLFFEFEIEGATIRKKLGSNRSNYTL